MRSKKMTLKYAHFFTTALNYCIEFKSNISQLM